MLRIPNSSESRWFIAPKKNIFYTTNWVQIDAKTDHTEIIARTTGIDAGSFIHFEEGNCFIGISCRFSWVPKRQTTRLEDIAYCLLRIIGVNMPLL